MIQYTSQPRPTVASIMHIRPRQDHDNFNVLKFQRSWCRFRIVIRTAAPINIMQEMPLSTSQQCTFAQTKFDSSVHLSQPSYDYNSREGIKSCCNIVCGFAFRAPVHVFVCTSCMARWQHTTKDIQHLLNTNRSKYMCMWHRWCDRAHTRAATCNEPGNLILWRFSLSDNVNFEMEI